VHSAVVSRSYLGGLGGPGYPVPLMSPETGFARFSSFTSLHRVPRSSKREVMLALNGSSADAQREKARWVVCRSEVKEEGCAQRRPGDMSVGTPPTSPSTKHVSQDNAQNRRQAKWAK
jgi:hypothetical protein